MTAAASLVPGYNRNYDGSNLGSIVSAGGLVSRFIDTGSDGVDLFQSTGPNQPTSGATSQNGLNTLLFSGGNFALVGQTQSDWTYLHAGPSTVFCVFKATTTGSLSPFGSDLNSGIRGVRLQYFSNGTVAVWEYDVTGDSGLVAQVSTAADAAWNENRWIVAALAVDPTNATAANRLTVYADNSSLNTSYGGNTATGAASASAPAFYFHLGDAGGTNPTGVDPHLSFTGEIAQWLSYSTLLGSTDIATNLAVLVAKWAA